MDFYLDSRSYGYLDPYVIAEIGVNHEGSIDRAIGMIDQVARAGGHAAKFQSYKAEKLAAKGFSPAYWDQSKETTDNQFELFQRFDSFGPDEFVILAEHCRSVGVDFMSTPFDLESVEYLDPLVKSFKIASADLTNVPLRRRVATAGKPIIMSCGASSIDEIAEALKDLLDSGSGPVTLLHCVLNYPTPQNHANLRGITSLIETFGNQVSVGYSDHVAPDADGSVPALEVASMLGSRVIEKHFTDDRQAPGNDHYHAFDEAGLRKFTDTLHSYRDLLGSGVVDLSVQQAAISNARRRIFAARLIPAGTVIEEHMLIALRANEGIEISSWDDVVGKVARVDLAPDRIINSEDLVAKG
jgi:sialic acid synthase SpsE